jgi:hypothetical protein
MTALLTPDQAVERLRQATRLVLDAEDAYERAVADSADAEAFYRKTLGDRFKEHRTAGKGVEESTTLARGECAAQSRERDHAAGILKLAAERMENARDSRRSLWRLIEWSSARDRMTPAPTGPAQQTLPENTPADRWP